MDLAIVMGNEHHILSSSLLIFEILELESNEQSLFTNLSSMSSSQAAHELFTIKVFLGFFYIVKEMMFLYKSNALYL